MNKKYIFLDIDGTLLCGDILPESALDALRRAKENGHELVICTGRSMYEIFPFLLEAFDFDGIVSSSGSRVSRGDQTVCHFFEQSEVRELCDYFRERKIPFTVMTARMTYSAGDELDLLIAERADSQAIDKAKGATERMDGQLEGVEQIDYYCGPEETAEVVEQFGDRFHVVPSEITPKGVSKASGIREYVELCGGDVTDTFAFGDSANDLTMVEFAGVGVAMGNACEALKAVADHVTDSVAYDGLAKAFDEFGLI